MPAKPLDRSVSGPFIPGLLQTPADISNGCAPDQIPLPYPVKQEMVTATLGGGRGLAIPLGISTGAVHFSKKPKLIQTRGHHPLADYTFTDFSVEIFWLL